jgi:hypothetical protein
LLAFLWGKRVGLWVTGDSDVKVIAILLPDVSNEVDPMFKAALDCLPVVLPCGWISAQSENITAAR